MRQSSLPFIENRPRVLRMAAFLSLLLHALFLSAAGLAPPLQNASMPDDAGISIDLAAIETPAARRLAQAAERDKSVAAPREPPMHGKTETVKTAPKKAAAKKGREPTKPATQNGTDPKKAASGAAQNAPAASSSGSNPSSRTIPPEPEADMPRPPYPELARRRGQEGTVNILCQVDASGRVVNASVAKSSGFRLLDEAALKTVGKWKFRPGKQDGSNAAGSVVVPVSFRLR